MVKNVLQDQVKDDAMVLDLMSSWRTHWPEGKPKQKIVGLGLNSEEMADNPDLDDFVVHNLNLSPVLPFESNQFDAVIITVSVQYLTNPFEVFKDVGRTLKEGGILIITFSNRMFPTKAVNIWKETDDMSRMELVKFYIEKSTEFEGIESQLMNPDRGFMDDPLFLVVAYKA